MSLALAACLVPPLPKLNRQKPAERMCTWTALARICIMAVALGLLDMSYSVFLVTRPWFAGGTGTAYMVSAICCSRQINQNPARIENDAHFDLPKTVAYHAASIELLNHCLLWILDCCCQKRVSRSSCLWLMHVHRSYMQSTG